MSHVVTLSAQTEQLEQRVAELERRLNAVNSALLTLIHGLEGTPLNEQGVATTHHAARVAHETLLAAGIREG